MAFHGNKLEKYKGKPKPGSITQASDLVTFRTSIDTTVPVVYDPWDDGDQYTPRMYGNGRAIFRTITEDPSATAVGADTQVPTLVYNDKGLISFACWDDYTTPPIFANGDDGISNHPNKSNVVLDGCVRGGSILYANDTDRLFWNHGLTTEGSVPGYEMNMRYHNSSQNFLYQTNTSFEGTCEIRFSTYNTGPSSNANPVQSTRPIWYNSSTTDQGKGGQVSTAEINEELNKLMQFRVRRIGIWLPHGLGQEDKGIGNINPNIDPYKYWNAQLQMTLFDDGKGKKSGPKGSYYDLYRKINQKDYKVAFDYVFDMGTHKGSIPKRKSCNFNFDMGNRKTILDYGTAGKKFEVITEKHPNNDRQVLRGVVEPGDGCGLTYAVEYSADPDDPALALDISGVKGCQGVEFCAPFQTEADTLKGKRPEYYVSADQQKYFNAGMLIKVNDTTSSRYCMPRNNRWVVVDIIRLANPSLTLAQINSKFITLGSIYNNGNVLSDGFKPQNQDPWYLAFKRNLLLATFHHKGVRQATFRERDGELKKCTVRTDLHSSEAMEMGQETTGELEESTVQHPEAMDPSNLGQFNAATKRTAEQQLEAEDRSKFSRTDAFDEDAEESMAAYARGMLSNSLNPSTGGNQPEMTSGFVTELNQSH